MIGVKMKSSCSIFQDFNEFWTYTKYLSNNQRNTLFSSLSSKERRKLEKSYKQGGWEDLFMRNCIDSIIDGIKKDKEIDLLKIKSQAIRGKCTYIKYNDWKDINEALSKYSDDHLRYVLGNIIIEKEGDMACLFYKKQR